jgi:hypothetical protein
MYRKYGFAVKPAAPRSAPLPVTRNALPFLQRTPARGTIGYRMGNVGDYINSPNFPGSSTMWLYGMGQEPDVAPQTSDGGFSFSTLIKGGQDLINTIATTGLPAYMQYEIYKTNLERAKQGQAPLDPNTYAPSVRVGADTATLNTARFGIGTVAVLGAAALALIFLLRRR